MSSEALQVDQRVERTAVILRAVGEVDAASAAVLSGQLAHAVEAVTLPGRPTAAGLTLRCPIG